MAQPPLETLHETLRLIEAADNDKDYPTRTQHVYKALALASHLGYPCGMRFDPSEGAAWPVVAITLPGVGEVAWHCQAYPHAYDGHSTEEKYRRVRVFVEPPLLPHGQKSALEKWLISGSPSAEAPGDGDEMLVDNPDALRAEIKTTLSNLFTKLSAPIESDDRIEEDGPD